MPSILRSDIDKFKNIDSWPKTSKHHRYGMIKDVYQILEWYMNGILNLMEIVVIKMQFIYFIIIYPDL